MSLICKKRLELGFPLRYNESLPSYLPIFINWQALRVLGKGISVAYFKLIILKYLLKTSQMKSTWINRVLFSYLTRTHAHLHTYTRYTLTR